MMKKNMGKVDRIIRICLAILIAVFIITGIIKGAVAVILGIFAVILFITSAIGFCALYVLLGISTCKIKDNTDSSDNSKYLELNYSPASHSFAGQAPNKLKLTGAKHRWNKQDRFVGVGISSRSEAVIFYCFLKQNIYTCYIL